MHKQINYPCLSRRQNGFHIRMAIPKRLWMLAKCKEICYPLHTACFEIAIMRWKKELAYLQKFLDVFEETCMLINKNNKVKTYRKRNNNMSCDTQIENVIKTERLMLTPLCVNDVNRYVDIAKNMRKAKEENPNYFLYVRFDHNSAKTDKDLKSAVMGLLTSAEKSVFPETTKQLNICLRNGHIIGYIGYLHNPNNQISSDLGIFLDPAYEHKGYAFEAQKSLLAYYFLNCDDKIYLTIYPQNIPSYQLNTKCGAVKIDHTNESKYGSERDILVITRKNFIETVFQKKLKTTEEEKIFLADYLKNYNQL